MVDFYRILLLMLLALQGVMMFLDEFYFHRQRGLGRFERWGHVVDTLCFVLALLVPAFLPPTAGYLGLYVGLSAFSCLLITKDEWIHAKECSAAEQWCHSLLFLLHSVILTVVGIVWFQKLNAFELKIIPAFAFTWALYQHFYWNVYHVRSRHQ